MRFFKSAEEKAAVEAARARILGAAAQLASATPDEARTLAQSLASDTSLAVLPAKERRKLEDEAFSNYAEAVLADDHLTEEEEDVFGEVADALEIPQESLTQVGQHRDIFVRFVVAKVNDGRLDTVESPRLIAKAGEVVHAETSAALMKEVAIRQFQGGGSGVSFRIGKGVRYHVGGFRGQSVIIGTELKVQDTGALSVTSNRVVFLGQQKTMEFLYAKLVGLEVFDDGIRLQVSNRQTVSLIKMDPGLGPVMAATINAAMQKTL
jgi:hypothetical protein